MKTEIDTLTSNAAWYDRWKDRADAASVALLLLTFLLAFVGNRLGTRLNKTNKTLIAAKEQLSALQIATVEANARKEEQKIKDAAEQKIADTYQEAKRIEATAQTEIARLTAETDKAREGIAKANDSAAQANERAQQLSLKVEEEARKRVEAEQELVEVQKTLEPRATGAKLQKFAGYLRDKPKARVRVFYQERENEARHLADNLSETLFDNGWDTKNVIQPVDDESWGEIEVRLSSPASELLPTAKALTDALQIAGFASVQLRWVPTVPKDEVHIVVFRRLSTLFPSTLRKLLHQ